MKRTTFFSLLLALSLLSACGQQAPQEASSGLWSQDSTDTEAQSVQAETSKASAVSSAETPVAAYISFPSISGNSEMFTGRELAPSYETAETILLKDGASSSDSGAVSIEDDTITITGEGVFEVSGTLSDGMIIVDVQDTEKVQLVLMDASIHSETSAAIYVRKADKVFLTLGEGTENSLSSGDSYTAIDENNIDAAVYSKDDLALGGSGHLAVTAPAGHAVVSKDDLVVAGGEYTLSAASSGLNGKESVRIAAGSFLIESGKDAIHAENPDDAEEGFVYIENGTFQLNAGGDGLSAGSDIQVLGGSFNVTAGQGHDAQLQQDENGEAVSAKGLKAARNITLSGGDLLLDCADDAIHANGDITVTGGGVEVSSGDDGFHADGTLTVSGGSILVTDSYEGLEGNIILISGGDIDITSQDDGLNAAGGADQSGMGWGSTPDDSFSAAAPELHISGGTLVIDSEGDSIDSNTSFDISGGDITLYGPVTSGNGMLDYNVEGMVSGGTVVGIGSMSMAENFSASSTQGAILLSVGSQTAGTEVTLTDESGNVLLSGTGKKDFNAVLLSCPELEAGKTYTVTAGESTQQITMDSLIYGAGGGMGGHQRGF